MMLRCQRILGRSGSRTNLYGDGFVAQRPEHVLVCCIVAQANCEIRLHVVQHVLGSRAFVHTNDPYFQDLVAVNDLQRRVGRELQ